MMIIDTSIILDKRFIDERYCMIETWSKTIVYDSFSGETLIPDSYDTRLINLYTDQLNYEYFQYLSDLSDYLNSI